MGSGRSTVSIVIIAALFGACYGQTYVSLGNVTSSNTGAVSNTQTRIFYELISPYAYNDLTFTLFPCFGEMNFFLGYGVSPNPAGNNTCNLLFAGIEREKYSCTIPFPRNNTIYQILVVGSGQYSGSASYSSVFDFLVTNDTGPTTLVPTPGDSGNLQTSLKTVMRGQPQELTVTWQGTGIDSDKYTIYQYNGTIPTNGGYITASGCGVKFFMSPRNDVAIQKNGETYTAVVTNLDAVNPSSVAVVVDREGGYTASYRVVFVNGGDTLQVFVLMSALLLFILLL